MLKKYLLLTLSTVSLTGCAEVMYDVLQGEAINNCKNLHEPERTACIKRNQTSYHTYRKQTYEKVQQRPASSASTPGPERMD